MCVFCLEDLLIGGDDAVFKAIADAYKALTEAGMSKAAVFWEVTAKPL